MSCPQETSDSGEEDSTGSDDLKARRVSKRDSTASKKKRGSKDTSQKKSVSAAEVIKSLGHVRVVGPKVTGAAKLPPAAAGKPSLSKSGVVKIPASTDREALKEEHDSDHESEDDEDDSEEESFESGDSAGYEEDDDPDNQDVITEDFLKRNPLSR